MSVENAMLEHEAPTSEDEAIDHIATELASDQWHVPENEVLSVVQRLRLPGTVMVSGNGYRVIRNPETIFKIVPENSDEHEDIQHAA